jgi:hypothetical protein
MTIAKAMRMPIAPVSHPPLCKIDSTWSGRTACVTNMIARSTKVKLNCPYEPRKLMRNHFHSPIYDVVEFAISLRTHNSWQELVDERIEHHTRIVCRLIIGWPKVTFLAVSAAAREDSETFHNNGIPVPGLDTSGAGFHESVNVFYDF